MDAKQNKKANDILNNITSYDAKSILRIILERHAELTDEIYLIAMELLSDVNSEDIAIDVFNELNSIQVEELWDRSGATRYGYVDSTEEAQIMFEEAIALFISEMHKCQKMGLTKAAKYYCIGIIKGILKYDKTSVSEFKDWAVDIPYVYIETVFEEWMKGNPSQCEITEVEAQKEMND